jgi:hypothetical protein
MEGSTIAARPVRHDPTTMRITRVSLLVASLGGILVIFDPWGLAVAGLVIAVAGTLVSSRAGLGHRWYSQIVVGAVLLVLSRLLAEGAQTLGGWLAVIGVLLILIGACLGYPLASDTEE